MLTFFLVWTHLFKESCQKVISTAYYQRKFTFDAFYVNKHIFLLK